ncbi:NAD(P)-dependent oxidoreductase [Spirosoma daeguense]
MKLLIIGATGSVGRLLVEQALEQGHTVTALVRNPAKLNTIQQANFQAIQGDVLDLASVKKAVCGQDVVLCAVGGGRKGGVRAEGTRNIIDAMRANGVKRLICQTTLGAGDSKGNLNFFWKYIMFGFLLRSAYADHEKQERYVQQSALDWILIRPAAFIDGPRTGNYQHGFSAAAKGLTLKISSADVADFMLKQLTSNTYLHKSPGLSY